MLDTTESSIGELTTFKDKNKDIGEYLSEIYEYNVASSSLRICRKKIKTEKLILVNVV